MIEPVWVTKSGSMKSGRIIAVPDPDRAVVVWDDGTIGTIEVEYLKEQKGTD